MSSRNNNYKHLEGGMGPTCPGAGKKLQWKKLAMACTMLIVWFEEMEEMVSCLVSPCQQYPYSSDPSALPDDVYPSGNR